MTYIDVTGVEDLTNGVVLSGYLNKGSSDSSGHASVRNGSDQDNQKGNIVEQSQVLGLSVRRNQEDDGTGTEDYTAKEREEREKKGGGGRSEKRSRGLE